MWSKGYRQRRALGWGSFPFKCGVMALMVPSPRGMWACCSSAIGFWVLKVFRLWKYRLLCGECGAAGYSKGPGKVAAACLTSSSKYYTRRSSLQIWLFLEKRVPQCCLQESGLQGPRETRNWILRWRRHPMKHETLAHLQQFPAVRRSLPSFVGVFSVSWKYVSCDFGNLQWVLHFRVYVYGYTGEYLCSGIYIKYLWRAKTIPGGNACTVKWQRKQSDYCLKVV